MSVQPSQPSGQSSGQSSGDQGGQSAGSDERRFPALIGSLAVPPADRQATAARPTFTARASGPAVVTEPPSADTPDSAGSPGAAPVNPAVTGTETEAGFDARPVPAASPVPPRSPEAARSPGAAAAPVSPDQEMTRALRRPGAATADEPLLGDVAGLRDRWQRVQAGFVDDPQQAVGDAADLIEQTAQALVGALRQRQRTLRVMWERGPADDSAAEDGEPAARVSDTEHLRLMMQRYRALFNQLCRP
jgi:hypothetical protein